MTILFEGRGPLTPVARSPIFPAPTQRDRFDSSREHSPLTEATGAVVVDTTGMSLDEVVAHIVSMLEGAS